MFFSAGEVKRENFEEVKARERKEGGPNWTRMPITIEVNGNKDNVWTEYQLGREIIAAKCNRCQKQDQELEIQNPITINVEPHNPEIEKAVKTMLEYLVKEVEKRMSVCDNCFDDDFLKNRPTLYVDTLEKVQRELGIDIDYEQQREAILSSAKKK